MSLQRNLPRKPSTTTNSTRFSLGFKFNPSKTIKLNSIFQIIKNLYKNKFPVIESIPTSPSKAQTKSKRKHISSSENLRINKVANLKAIDLCLVRQLSWAV